jgi:iron(III) transport system substrate-binding protein
VDIVVKPIGQLQKQTEDEIAAGKVSVDIIAMNVLAWADALAKRGKLMPFESPEYDAYNHLGAGLVNRPYYVSDPTITWNIAWNSDLIKGNEFKSWFDLLRPEYKGKMTVISARLSQSAAVNFKAMRETPEIGMDFFKRLAELEPVPVTLTDTAVVKLQSGEFPITLVPSTRPYAAWKRGARNIGQSFAKEGVVPLGIPWMILADAPRPNAAKLLVHYARSREGQQLLADLEGRISGRTDVKSPNPVHVPDISKLKLIKVDEVNISQQEFRTLGQEWRTLFGT